MKEGSVPPDQVEQWRNSAKALMTPNFVGGDNIKQRIEDQVLDELEVKKLTPFQFDYANSKVLMYSNLELKRGIEMNEILDSETPDYTNVKTTERRNKNYFAKGQGKHKLSQKKL
jgi:hypothetical protein